MQRRCECFEPGEEVLRSEGNQREQRPKVQAMLGNGVFGPNMYDVLSIPNG